MLFSDDTSWDQKWLDFSINIIIKLVSIEKKDLSEDEETDRTLGLEDLCIGVIAYATNNQNITAQEVYKIANNLLQVVHSRYPASAGLIIEELYQCKKMEISWNDYMSLIDTYLLPIYEGYDSNLIALQKTGIRAEAVYIILYDYCKHAPYNENHHEAVKFAKHFKDCFLKDIGAIKKYLKDNQTLIATYYKEEKQENSVKEKSITPPLEKQCDEVFKFLIVQYASITETITLLRRGGEIKTFLQQAFFTKTDPLSYSYNNG